VLKKVQQRLFNLRRPKKCTIESIMSGCIAA
jgi:hypothetical protein